MRLSEWLAVAPHKESATPKVVGVIEPMLAMLGADPDPECWLAWGDDPAMRYTVFAATDAGLAQVNVRVNVPGEGPRAGGKLIRWNRVQLGDLAVEMQGGHRILSIPLEGVILRGTDETADQVAMFVLDALAAIDGRPRGGSGPAPARASSGKAGTKGASKAGPKAVPLGPSGSAPRRRPVPLLEAPKGPST